MEVIYINTEALGQRFSDQFFESEFWRNLVMYSHEKTSDRILEHISKQINLDVISGQFGLWGTYVEMEFFYDEVCVVIPCEMLLRYSGDYSSAKIKDFSIDKNSFVRDFSVFDTVEDDKSMIMSVRFKWEVTFPFSEIDVSFNLN